MVCEFYLNKYVLKNSNCTPRNLCVLLKLNKDDFLKRYFQKALDGIHTPNAKDIQQALSQ